MGEVCTVQVDDLIVEGMKGDYVFETIKRRNTFYENSILEKWLPYMRDSKIILDIGANLGNHTLFWAKNTDYLSIYAFEPYQVSYERLRDNIANNHLSNVFPLNYGVGEHNGYSKVVNFSEDNYGATTLDTVIRDSGDVRIISIDAFVSEQGLENVDFVKIDTEGFEESVLSGMKQVIESCHPDIWIEVSEDSFREIIEALLSQGYVMADIEGFNMLFLSEKRHKGICQADIMNILKQHFNNLARTNKYYQNYNTAKGWVSTKNTMIEALNHNIAVKEEMLEKELLKNAELVEDVQQLERKLSEFESENHALNRQLQEIQNGNNEFAEDLVDIVQSQETQIQVMLRARHTIQSQQRELQLLRQESEQNRQRWDRISGKWYGRLALKIYYRLRVSNILK
nr:FkbM family methyltransferase [uncultured Acetatifactor sp.]